MSDVVSKSAHEANSKFEGFEGSFASLREFHAGAEKTLNLGYPNPDIMKGIRLEHTKHSSAKRHFVTPNYRVVTSLHIEYAWAVLNEGTEELDEKEVRCSALNLVRELVTARGGDSTASASTPDTQPFFPGEVGDSFPESLLMLILPSGTVGSAGMAKVCMAAATKKAEALLTTDEEKVRGVTTLDHGTCVERIQRGASVLRTEQNAQAAIADDSLRVGVMLPMSSARAETALDALRESVAAAAGLEPQLVTAEVTECTWAFSRFTGIEALRKWLAEQSLDGLTKVLADEREGGAWAVAAGADLSTHEALSRAMVASFVRTELRADLRCTLERGASDAQIEELLRGWNVPEPWSAARASRIERAAAALDCEERWDMVKGWVRLYRGRIQGRTRLGLRRLMKREAAKIQLHRLKAGEVLGIYLYTGPEYMPMNGICRSYPQSILDLLKGEGATADNRLCTTLFCISSALKKLSQTTELPASGCAP